MQDSVEAFRTGSRGPAWEAALFTRTWGFRLEKVRAHVSLWQGDEDLIVPVEMARYQTEALPHAQLEVFPGEAHLAIFDHADEVLEAMTF
jgi:pimeloyl-ACP methyl ester carboxylesterase